MSSIFDLAKTAAGDLDQDGYPDLVTANAGAGELGVFLTRDPACGP